jgi:hypothetical protein
MMSGDNGRGSGTTSRLGDAGGVDDAGSGAKSDADSTMYGECGGATSALLTVAGDANDFLSLLGKSASSFRTADDDDDIFLASFCGDVVDGLSILVFFFLFSGDANVFFRGEAACSSSGTSLLLCGDDVSGFG